jgi:DNA-binding XRE family transcriptional regulator/membrane protein YdbS with pleckstrin-like domain
MNNNPPEIKEEEVHQIDSRYVQRTMIGSLIGSIFIALGTYGVGWFVILIANDDGTDINRVTLWTIILWVILAELLLINGLNYLFSKMYLKNFSYSFSEKFITIRYGILTRTKTTIPYSRIQNVAVYQNIRDRILNIHTVKIETAGSSAATANAQKGLARPEGYIPAVSDPTRLESIINKLVHQYTQDISGPIKKNVFIDNNVAFDEFIAYFLSKMREKDQIQTNIAHLRTQANLTQVELAEKLGVAETTVKYLEAGEFVPSLTLALEIAKLFGISIEDIFQLKK